MKTFAYLLLSCSRDDEIHDELQQDWSYPDGDGIRDSGGIIEIFSSWEGQADSINDDDLLPYWQEWMNRIAPVQMTFGWDCRKYLLNVFQQLDIEANYQIDKAKSETEGHIIFFDTLPDSKELSVVAQLTDDEVPNLKDKIRFDQVLAATIQLAQTENRGVLFIGHWGWDYEVDSRHLLHPEVQAALRRAGLQFVTRREE